MPKPKTASTRKSRGTDRASYRFTPDDLGLIEAVASAISVDLGTPISATAAIRIAMREAARKRGINLDPKK